MYPFNFETRFNTRKSFIAAGKNNFPGRIPLLNVILPPLEIQIIAVKSFTFEFLIL